MVHGYKHLNIAKSPEISIKCNVASFHYQIKSVLFFVTYLMIIFKRPTCFAFLLCSDGFCLTYGVWRRGTKYDFRTPLSQLHYKLFFYKDAFVFVPRSLIKQVVIYDTCKLVVCRYF